MASNSRCTLALGALVVTLHSNPGAAAEIRPEARLTPPANGPIPVAFLISEGATIIDFTGPWEVFQDVNLPGQGFGHAFRMYTVAESRDPITASGGMRIVPDFAFADAPAPRVVVVPAQRGSEAGIAWLRRVAPTTDLTMSVCTGAFQLARAGLLDGRKATTHHEFYGTFARTFPAIDVQQGLRWVEGPRIATAGGLTSGIDLALRVVARYHGEEIAAATARYMEHAGEGWKASGGIWDGSTAQEAAREAERRRSSAATSEAPALRGLDPVLLTRGREERGRTDLHARHGRYVYAFASEATRDEFRASPEAFAIRLDGACAMMAADGGAPGSGDPDRFLVHDAGIYIFASDGCRESFKRNPVGGDRRP